ncbi:2Fe-2S iron-sulfur cluster-binding protein [Xanthobacter sediminis]
MDLHIRPLGRTLSVEPGANLLETLRANDVPISYSCMAGRCGICRYKVISGHLLGSSGELRQPSLPGQDEILACQSTLAGPLTIEIPEPDEVVVYPAKILKGIVVAMEAATHDIQILHIKPNKPLEHAPGQFATLQFTPDHIRPYSMASITGDDVLEFHIRLVLGGRVSPYVFETLKIGDAVRVSGPLGASYLRAKHSGPILCVAGGTGLAPALSIIRGARAASMAEPIHLYFGVRTAQDLYCADRLSAWAGSDPNFHLHIVIANGAVPPNLRRGLVTDAITEDWKSLSGFRAYLCGPPPLVEATTILAKRLGLPPEHIYADAFYSTGF